MRVLYIGGTGEISTACVAASVARGHDVAVFNRGLRPVELPPGVEHVVGAVDDDAALAGLARRHFDVVCQFIAFRPEQVERDLRIFGGQCGQYVFVSTASAYEKPCRVDRITEDTPLANPFWAYSRAKIACEERLRERAEPCDLPVTIVRPSHTYRTRLPSTVVDGDHLAWRLLRGKPVLVHGDGESVWTLTHAEDFARAFTGICGNEAALGESVHITNDDGHTWNLILEAVATLLGVEARIVPVASRTLVDYVPDWEGPLLGDKSNTLRFDTRRIERLVPGWRCELSLAEGLERVRPHAQARLAADYAPDAELDALVDRIVAERSGGRAV